MRKKILNSAFFFSKKYSNRIHVSNRFQYIWLPGYEFTCKRGTKEVRILVSLTQCKSVAFD